jgi:hypothetical protein
MPKGKPDKGTVFFVYRAKLATGSSIHTAGVITEEQHRAIALILQGKPATRPRFDEIYLYTQNT